MENLKLCAVEKRLSRRLREFFYGDDVRNVLKTWLTIPSVQQRPPVSKWWGLKVFPAYKPKKEWDDVYIYAQLSQVSVIVGMVIGIVIVMLYQTGGYDDLMRAFVQDDIWAMEDTSIRIINYIHAFNIVFRQTLLFVLLPFFFFKMLWNVNLKKYDTFAFLYPFQQKPSTSRRKTAVVLWGALFMLYLSTHLLHALPYFVFFRVMPLDNIMGLFVFRGLGVYFSSFAISLTLVPMMLTCSLVLQKKL